LFREVVMRREQPDAVLQEQRPQVCSELLQLEVQQLGHLPCEFFRQFQFREQKLD
jgi:hypothetical protein